MSGRSTGHGADERVLAQGTFDVVHPGHLHYLREAATFGTELCVVVARRRGVDHKARPVLPDRQRRDVVAALDPVDRAVLGHPRDILVPVRELAPDVVVLGHDQHHDVDEVSDALAARGVDCRVVRASARKPRYAGELLSSSDVIDRILDRRGDDG